MPSAHPFALERPRSVTEAVAILAEHADDARIMAGGQSLTPLLTLGFSSPAVVVSLDRCDELDRLDRRADGAGIGVGIGAMATTARLAAASLEAEDFPLLRHAAARVGSPHVRNFGTVVGNVCHADPGSDLIPALLCYETTVDLRSPGGQRSVGLGQFITGPFTTAVDESELAVGVEVGDATADGWTFAYRKLVKRSGDLAIATCAVRSRVEAGHIIEAKIALGGALSVAKRLSNLEQALIGTAVGEAAQTATMADLSADTASRLMPDVHAPLPYLNMMLPRFVAATVGEAVSKEAVR